MSGYESRFVSAGGLDIHYLEAGGGPDLVLLHGGLATAETAWGKRIADLAKDYRVLAPDSRGHGRTVNPATTLSYTQMADDVAAFITALGLEHPHVAGYSDGGQIGLELALRHSGVARSLVLGGTVSGPSTLYVDGLSTWGFPSPGEVDFAKLADVWGDFYRSFPTLHPGDGSPDYWRVFLQQISELWWNVPAYSDAELALVADPALIVMGDRDQLGGLDQPIRLYRAIPGAEFGVVPGSPHGAADRDVFWAMVRDFHARLAEKT